jgi:hypothetical protein
MSLWAIAKSPLILGADLTKLDAFTESLLTNKTVLAINQNSIKNKQLYNNKGVVLWSAEDPSTKDHYAAVFNTYDQYDVSNGDLISDGEMVNRETPGQGLPVLANLEGYSKLGLVVQDGGDGLQFDHAVWVKPTVELSFGTTIDLTKESWISASVGYGEPSTKSAPEGKPLSVKGTQVTSGIFAHAPSTLIYKLPAGAKAFSAFGALNDTALTAPKGGTIQFMVYGFKDGGPQDRTSRRMSFDLGPAGAKAGNKVTDVWTGETWTLESQTTILEIPWHGVRLLKISNR